MAFARRRSGSVKWFPGLISKQCGMSRLMRISRILSVHSPTRLMTGFRVPLSLSPSERDTKSGLTAIGCETAYSMNPGYQKDAEPQAIRAKRSVFQQLHRAKSPANEYPAKALYNGGAGSPASASGIILPCSSFRCLLAFPLNGGCPFRTPGAAHGVSSSSKSKS